MIRWRRGRTSRSTTRCSAHAPSITTAGKRWSSTRRPSSPTTAPTPRDRSTKTSGSSTTWPRISPRSPTWPTRIRRSWRSSRISGGKRRNGSRFSRSTTNPGSSATLAIAAITTNSSDRSVPWRKRWRRTSRTGRSSSPPISCPLSGRLPTGVIAAHGSHAGGYVLFIDDGRLHFTYNYVATQITTVTAEVLLPSEPLTVRAVFTRTGAGGDLELFYGDVPVGRGADPHDDPPDLRHPWICRRFSAGRADQSRPGRTGRAPANHAAPRGHRDLRPRPDPRRAGRVTCRPRHAIAPRRRNVGSPTAQAASIDSSDTGRAALALGPPPPKSAFAPLLLPCHSGPKIKETTAKHEEMNACGRGVTGDCSS